MPYYLRFIASLPLHEQRDLIARAAAQIGAETRELLAVAKQLNLTEQVPL